MAGATSRYSRSPLPPKTKKKEKRNCVAVELWLDTRQQHYLRKHWNCRIGNNLRRANNTRIDTNDEISIFHLKMNFWVFTI